MKLRQAHNYEEWKQTALELDEFLGFDEWKAIDEDPYYDWKLVRKVLRSLRLLRKNKDVRGVLGVLERAAGQWEDPRALHLERFVAAQPAGEQAAETPGDHPFTIELADGAEVQVPADRTVLEALEDAGSCDSMTIF